MDTPKTTAPATHPATECFACYEGLIFLGHLVENEDGEEVEIVEAVSCRRCSSDRLVKAGS